MRIIWKGGGGEEAPADEGGRLALDSATAGGTGASVAAATVIGGRSALVGVSSDPGLSGTFFARPKENTTRKKTVRIMPQ